MRKELKYGIFIVAGFIFIAAILTIFLLANSPKSPTVQGFYVTIKGNITVPESYTNSSSKPQVITAYPAVYNPLNPDIYDNLCGQADLGNIENVSWSGNVGTYSLTLHLPVEQEIIVTTWCASCNYQPLYVTPENSVYNINLNWDNTECSNTQRVANNSNEEIKRANMALDNARQSLTTGNFGDNVTAITKRINDLLSQGYYRLQDAPNEDNETLKYFDSLYAEMYGQSAMMQIELADLNTCLGQITKTINSHNNSCYNIPYEAYDKYVAVNNTYNSYSSMYAMDRYGYDVSQLQYMPNVAENIIGMQNQIRISYSTCQSALTMINQSASYQELYCKKRNSLIQIIAWPYILAALIAGAMLGKFGTRWNKKNSKKKK